jgi:two-component system chemotaxis response regulator CheB
MAHIPPLRHDRPIGKRDIIVIGASAGGVPALQSLVSTLPPGLPAAAFIVMHVPAWHRSELRGILSRHSSMPVSNPAPHQTIETGHIYVAPADHHLIIERDRRIALWHGPKENNFRPSINTLFRSAADVYGDRVIGVILTGTLEDGVAGLAWIKRHGGIAVVQDPQEATFPSLPQNVLHHVKVDHVAGLRAIGPLLIDLVAGNSPDPAHPLKGGF